MDTVRTLLPASPSALAAFGLLATIIYCLAVTFYRLFLHPIARFPGPKSAALTRWYEFYYEIVQQGQMTFHIQDLHKKYGRLFLLFIGLRD